MPTSMPSTSAPDKASTPRNPSIESYGSSTVINTKKSHIKSSEEQKSGPEKSTSDAAALAAVAAKRFDEWYQSLSRGDPCDVFYCKEWVPAEVARVDEETSSKRVLYLRVGGSIDEIYGYKIREPKLPREAEEGRKKRKRKRISLFQPEGKQTVYRPKGYQKAKKKKQSDPNSPAHKNTKSNTPKLKSSGPKSSGPKSSGPKSSGPRSSGPKAGAKKTGSKKKGATNPNKRNKGSSKKGTKGAKETLETEGSGPDSKRDENASPAAKKHTSSANGLPDEEQEKEALDEPLGVSGNTVTVWSRGIWYKCLEINLQAEKRKLVNAIRKAKKGLAK